jgi:hypothetical protein
LHLPYLTLREPQTAPTHPHSGGSHGNEEPWGDLTFLGIGNYDAGTVGRYSIYSAHATIVVAGWDQSKYTGYSFLNPGPAVYQQDKDEEEEEDDDDDDQDKEDCHHEESDSDLEPSEDEFATDGWIEFLKADDRSWDPRVCFIWAVQIRIVLALQEYKYLIAHLGDVEAWVNLTWIYLRVVLTVLQLNRSLDLTTRTMGRGARSQKCLSHTQLADCVTRITMLIIRLRDVLSETIRAWTKFNGPHGDIAYFSDLTNERAVAAIANIRDAFEDLTGLEQKLKSMESCCKELAEAVSFENPIAILNTYHRPSLIGLSIARITH